MPRPDNTSGTLLKELLKSDLHLSAHAVFQDAMPISVSGAYLRPDYIIKDGKILYLVEVKNYATEQSLSRLALLKQLQKDGGKDIKYVLAAKNIPTTVSDMAQRIDVILLQLPLNVPVNTSDDEGRITTENAWKVVTAILSKELTSIKGISNRTGISYGWAHRISNRLMARGIAEKFNDQIRIANHAKLINMAALERPMIGMNKGIVWTGYTASHDAAAGLTRSLEKSGIQFAFTGFTAASIYIASAIRHDSVYLYLKDELDRSLLKSNEVQNLRGIKVHVYLPDRDVFTDSRKIKGIRVVSKGQSLLDMAGFGRSGGDLALEMAKKYASIVDSS
jgi:hypothetical protein